MSGNNVSHAHNRTKRLFEPNLHNHRFWSENQKKWFKWELDIESSSGLRRGLAYPGLLTSCSNSLSNSSSFYVAVGDDGNILTSPDGCAWTSRTSDNDKYLQDVIYGNNSFVAVGA